MAQEKGQELVVVRLTPQRTNLERRGSVVVGVRNPILKDSIISVLQALNIEAFEC